MAESGKTLYEDKSRPRCYTRFASSDLIVTLAIAQDGEVTVTCKLTNTGARAGDEVPQLYFRQSVTSVTTYELSLVGCERVSLAPGECKTVNRQVLPTIGLIPQRWPTPEGRLPILARIVRR